MSVLSIVTVRKGSKGLKDKCIHHIGDKMVFQYTLEYSLKIARHIDNTTLVTSDSTIVGDFCKAWHIPFIKRAPELCSEKAEIEDVIYDAYKRTQREFDYISLLYGNVPTRYPLRFIEAYNFLEHNKDYDCVLSMQKTGKFNPSWMFDYTDKTLPKKKHESARRQELQEKMIHDGHTILFRPKHFLEFMESKKEKEYMYEYLGRKIKPHIYENIVVDIDDYNDLVIAKAVIGCG